jgi:hypothetical protein
VDRADFDDRCRVAVYRGFARDGRAPELEALCADLGAEANEVVSALRRMAAARLLVVDGADPPSIVMAHPFSSIPLGFSAMGPTTLWWGGCAWDAFSLAQLVPDAPSVLVATTCPACGRALSWTVSRDSPPEGDEVAHFLVPVGHMWDDVVHTCSHQRLFCSRQHVENWLSGHGHREGSILDLATLWRLARGWYAGRLDPGYQRREPADAKDYLRAVGVTGAFWGL